MNTQDDISKITDLISMLILKEKNLGLDTSFSQGKTNSYQAFYSSTGRGRGCGRGQGNGRDHLYGAQQSQGHTVGRGQSPSKGSQRGKGARSSKQQNIADSRGCWSCGKKGHMQRDYLKGKASGKRKHGNYKSTSKDVGEGKSERMFIMQHVMNTMIAENPTKDDVWYVDLVASNLMPSCGEWFKDMRKTKSVWLCADKR